MKKYTADELKEILEKHAKWRRGEIGGARANLADANLAGANLARANLAGAYLAGANLAGADLADANLARAYLAGAYLADADLAGADLAGADLARAYLAGAYLADANLAGANLADANLAGAYLAGADLAGARRAPPSLNDHKDPVEPYVRKPGAATREERMKRYRAAHPEVPVVENLDAKILEAITLGGGSLDMGAWHSCETTHCRAGWAIHLAGQAGYALEAEYDPQVAGKMIYRASTGRVPHFFASNEHALEDIKACAAGRAVSP